MILRFMLFKNISFNVEVNEIRWKSNRGIYSN